MKISHSKREKYELCSEKYRLYYVEKLRSPTISSPLFFGSALDEAFSRLLLDKKPNLTPEELEQLKNTPEDIFVQKMLKVEHNGQIVQLDKSLQADYFAKDFTPELLLPSHVNLLQEYEPAYSLVDFIDFHKQCQEQLGQKRRIHADDKELFNYMTWLNLVEKGKLMITAYKDTVVPQIQTVHDIQKSISVKNEDGDEIVGLIDFTANFTGDDKLYVCDNKTSSTAYKADSVQNSDQLATYCQAEGTDSAAYVVVEKKLFKKEPKIHINVIKDTIPEERYVKTFDKFDQTVYNIEQGWFEKNWKSCYTFGRRCEYYNLCKNGDSTGLVRLKSKVEHEEL